MEAPRRERTPTLKDLAAHSAETIKDGKEAASAETLVDGKKAEARAEKAEAHVEAQEPAETIPDKGRRLIKIAEQAAAEAQAEAQQASLREQAAGDDIAFAKAEQKKQYGSAQLASLMGHQVNQAERQHLRAAADREAAQERAGDAGRFAELHRMYGSKSPAEQQQIVQSDPEKGRDINLYKSMAAEFKKIDQANQAESGQDRMAA